MAALGEAARDRLRAETIGYIFQTFNLLQGHTVLENVEFGMAFGRSGAPTIADAIRSVRVEFDVQWAGPLSHRAP